MTNLIVIDCHDLGQHLGCYGWHGVPSKNLDQLASKGVRFSNSFCTAPQCSPSRSALYTGRYPHANGMLGLAHTPFDWRLQNTEVHLARLLKDEGYHTALIGVQHLTSNDEHAIQSMGFDQQQISQGTREIAEGVVQFLEQEHSQPFFLKVGFFDPHRDAQGYFGQAPTDYSHGVSIPSFIPNTTQAKQEFAQLQGVIGQLDDAVGMIWAALEAQHHLDNTWLIFTTDHGIAMPRAKTTMYDAGLQTTLIMYSKSLALSDRREINELVSHVDLVPTILEGLNITVPEHVQGQSYWGLLHQGDYQQRQYIFAEKTFHTAYEPQRAIRSIRYKLIWNAEVNITNVAADIQHSPIFPQMIDELTQSRPIFELYDLYVDPLERNNISGLAEFAEVKQELREALLKWMYDTNDPLLNGAISSPYYDRAKRQLLGEDIKH